jgi:hypothetical protein
MSKKLLMLGVGLIISLPLMTGCESSSSSSSAPIISVDPGSATLEGEGSVVFTASVDEDKELFLPLDWSVDDGGLGRITGSGGLTAVYESFGGEGVNTVKVRDQSGSEGVAVVIQE